jgi:hypothetical protein
MPADEIGTVVATGPEPKAERVANPQPAGFLSGAGGWTLWIVLFLALAIFRIVSTYHLFNQTIDEASHIAGGVEWWEKGTYTLEPKHTPLARISVALGPYLSGVRGNGATRWQDTYSILSENGRYWHNLIAGRLGVIPYFVIATLIVFFWTKRLFGWASAVLAVAIFTQLPTILAHSSNATTDMALTAMLCWALYAFVRWLREPDFRTASLFGVAAGLALATKLSTVVFLPACAAPVLVMFAKSGQARWRLHLQTSLVAALCAFLSLWAVYRFSHVPLAQATQIPERVSARYFGPSSSFTAAVHAVTSHVPVPAPEFFDGIRMLRDQNRQGSRGYLFGEVRDGGWWYFFFVALALKTPIAVLLLSCLGGVLVVRQYWRDTQNWEVVAPFAAFAMIMLSSMPSHLDSGVRYVLPVFVFLSILAAFGLTSLWNVEGHRTVCRSAAVLLFGWLTLSSAISHPDYLAYFNEFGGKDPSHKIVVGDLDWGQDFSRLASYLREHSINHVSVAADTFIEPSPLGLPQTEFLKCNGPKPSGWVAVELRRERLHLECYPWLAQQRAVTRVGKTMDIYYLQ